MIRRRTPLKITKYYLFKNELKSLVTFQKYFLQDIVKISIKQLNVDNVHSLSQR